MLNNSLFVIVLIRKWTISCWYLKIQLSKGFGVERYRDETYMFLMMKCC
jgi:hypothetical protein